MPFAVAFDLPIKRVDRRGRSQFMNSMRNCQIAARVLPAASASFIMNNKFALAEGKTIKLGQRKLHISSVFSGLGN